MVMVAASGAVAGGLNVRLDLLAGVAADVLPVLECTLSTWTVTPTSR
jgi:hypothetical protein